MAWDSSKICNIFDDRYECECNLCILFTFITPKISDTDAKLFSIHTQHYIFLSRFFVSCSVRCFFFSLYLHFKNKKSQCCCVHFFFVSYFLLNVRTHCEHQFGFENGVKRAEIVPILVEIGATERTQWNIEFGMENNKTLYARTHSVRSKYTHTLWIGVTKTLNTFLLAIFTMHIEIDIRNYLLHNITLISFEYNFPILFVYLLVCWFL